MSTKADLIRNKLGRPATRKKVLAGLGGQCAWCQATDAPLEIDHVDGNGNKHRREIGMPLTEWLHQEYERTGHWSRLVQLLCKSCHDRKSGRIKMPPRQGHRQVNVSLPADLALELDMRAVNYEGGKSAYVEMSLRAQIEQGVMQTAVDGFHQRLSSTHSDVKGSLETLMAHVKILTALVQGLDARMRAGEDKDDRRYDALLKAFDRLKSDETKHERGGLFSFAQRKTS